MLALLAALLQEAPVIDRAELLTGGAFRPRHWAPLEVGIRSTVGGESDLVVRTDVGFSIVRRLALSPGRSETVVPVLALYLDAPLEIELRREGRTLARYRRRSLGRGISQSERLIGAGGPAPDERTVVFSYDPKRTRLEWLEGVDAVVGTAPEGYSAMGGIVASDLSDALRKIDSRGPFFSRWFDPVDADLHRLAPRGAWIETKKRSAALGSVLYVFAALVVMGWLARRRPSWSWAGAAGLAGGGTLLFLAAYPRGSLSVTRQGCEFEGARVETYFVKRARDGTAEVSFPCLVKPIFPSPLDASQERFELHVSEDASRVIGMRLAAGDSRIFAGIVAGGEARIRCRREGERIVFSGQARGAGAVDGSRVARFGDVDGSASAVGQEGPPPEDEAVRYFSAKLMAGAAYAYGWRADGGAGVRAADMAEDRARPTLLLSPIR